MIYANKCIVMSNKIGFQQHYCNLDDCAIKSNHNDNVNHLRQYPFQHSKTACLNRGNEATFLDPHNPSNLGERHQQLQCSDSIWCDKHSKVEWIRLNLPGRLN